MEVFRLRNKNALMIPAFQAFLERARQAVPNFAPGGLSSIVPDLIDYIERDDHFFFLGVESGEYASMVLGNMPGRMFFPHPLVSIAYNEGSKTLLSEVRERVIDHIIEAGYTKIWAMNGSGRADATWLRAFKSPRLEPELIGSAFEFKVK